MKLILRKTGFVLGITLGCLLPIISQAGDLIGFSNSIVYPKEQAYRYFNDSNLDWGQQSQRISEVVTEKFNGRKLYINYKWNPYAIGYYGTENSQFNPENPPKGSLVAVIATQLSAKDYVYFQDKTPDYVLDKNTYFYLIPAE